MYSLKLHPSESGNSAGIKKSQLEYIPFFLKLWIELALALARQVA